MVISLITASLLAATAILAPTLARAAPPGSTAWQSPVGALDLLTGFDPPPLRWLPGHRGVDLAAGDAQQVTAAGDGTVVFAGDLAGRGVVSVAHGNGLRTTYEPVEPLVSAGETVAAGQPIGTLQAGHASCAGSVCLHFGLKRGPLYLDPMLLFGSGKVRLLPRPGKAGAAGRFSGETGRAATIREREVGPEAPRLTAVRTPARPSLAAVPLSEPDTGKAVKATSARVPKAMSREGFARAAEPRWDRLGRGGEGLRP